MKKLLVALCLFAVSVVSAQTNTTFRYGTTKNADNTGRVLNYAVITTTDVTSATIDTITFQPNAWETNFRPAANLADSVVYKFNSNVNTYQVGDRCTFYITKGTGNGSFKFGGSKYVLSTATNQVPITANKVAIISFRWNGAKWVESDRMVQP